MRKIICCALIGTGLFIGTLWAAPLGTAFTYQGQLIKGGSPVTDTCDFTFGLWDEEVAGNEVGNSPQGPLSIAVESGIFTAAIDFDAGAITGQGRWLEIAVECPGDLGGPTTLSPRVELTPALHALALPGLYTQENATSPNLIGGFSGNTVTGGVVGATISGGGAAGGFNNRATDDYGTIGGGRNNQAGDGAGSTNDRPYATVGGGNHNTASGPWSTVGGGRTNTASNEMSTIGGGNANTASGFNSTVGGGQANTASGERSTVGGGWSNTASFRSTVGGGLLNTASGSNSSVGGGSSNTASGSSSTVGGGAGNTASGAQSTVGGGLNNTASGFISTVGGGEINTASGPRSTVPGGSANQAGGTYSFAAGRRAKVRDAAQAGNTTGDQGTFMWADSTNADFTSDGQNRFLVRASGGARIYSNSSLTTGVSLAAGGGSWSSISDSNLKENIVEVDGRDVLERLSRVPIATWNYTSQDPSIRHMGPMGQDFHEAFQIGDEPPRISTIDADGVALAAIQGLHEIVKEKDCEITELREQKDDLARRNAELEARLNRIEALLADRLTDQKEGAR